MKATTFPVVGIGASAGGLEALERLFRNLPPNLGAAFVLILHRPYNKKSLLLGLLQKFTKMEVFEIRHGMEIQVNCVYFSPPRQNVSLYKGGIFSFPDPLLTPWNSMGIDFFFRTLAETQRENAIGVLLSGGGTDGTLGVKAIREAGGETVVQDPCISKYPEMARNAIKSGFVNTSIPVEELSGVTLVIFEQVASKEPGTSGKNKGRKKKRPSKEPSNRVN
ncbi:chemotaxis protein CheB, partial [bacterium]|nr:chemotaxis protein CheB [bacterium]